MSKRISRSKPALKDWHLWTEVKRTIRPLRPEFETTLAEEPLPLPEPVGKSPPVFSKTAKWAGPALPAYRPNTSAKAKTEPGQVIEPRMRRRLVRGQIEIDGLSSVWRDRVRLMFQEPRLLPWQRVAANVEVGVSHAPSGNERRRSAMEAPYQVGLSGREQEWQSILSGGQKQRVALVGHWSAIPRSSRPANRSVLRAR